MVGRTVNGGKRDYLIVEYAPSRRNQPPDRLFVPTDALDQLPRYVGGESPALSKLGGADWQKTKGQARKAVKQIAAELRLDLDPGLESPRALGPLVDPAFHSCGTVPPHG